MRPFNLEHAKAGAPVRLSDGTESVRIICFDYKGSAGPILACIGNDRFENVYVFGADGRMHGNTGHQLAMRALGTCQGREVHWGDKLVDAAGTVMVGNDWTQEDFDQCTWPAQYPVTWMTTDEINEVFDRSHNMLQKVILPAESCRNIANAAIKHGIDNGYLFAAPLSVPSDDELLKAYDGDDMMGYRHLGKYELEKFKLRLRRVWDLRGV